MSGTPAPGATGWEDLVSTALVGSDRRAVPDASAAGVRVTADGRDAAEVLLDRAALLATERRAGQPVGRVEPLPAAPVDGQPVVGRAGSNRLAQLLTDAPASHGLLEEWLALVAARGFRVPEDRLPELLGRGQREHALRPLIGRVAGRRGRWLATLNPAWAYALAEAGAETGPDGQEAWELGGSQERRGHLARLRRRDPAAARELLAASWATETPEDRAAFLAVLGDGLSPADEEFLEAALDDRRQAVRELAVDLLARLPGSALGRRTAERALRCLRLERRPLGLGVWLVVEAPAECDRAMQRDGVRRRVPKGGKGTAVTQEDERGWWLQQLVTRTPLSAWVGHLGDTPAQIVRLRSQRPTSWLEQGWLRAAVLQQDTAWADALLAHVSRSGQLAVDALLELQRTVWLATPAGRQPEPTRLLTVVSPAAGQEFAAGLLTGSYRVHEVVGLLEGLPGPWRGVLADRLLDTLRDTRTRPWDRGLLCRVAALRLAPDLHARVAGLLPDPPAEVATLADALRFRHDMRKELESP